MKKSRPLGIRQTLWLAIGLTVTSVVLGASALYSYRLYRGHHEAERLRVAAIAETYAAQVAPLLASGLRAEAGAFVQNVPWNRGSCLLAILGSQDQTVAVRGNALLLERFQPPPGAASTGPRAGSWHVPADPKKLTPELGLAAVPIRLENSAERLGTLVYGVRLARASGVGMEEVWRFFAGLMLIAATGIVLAVLWLKQKVLRPLACLVEESEDQAGRKAILSLVARRRDEIGKVARILVDMHLDRNAWRGRASRLERSVNDLVATETRKITRELRRARKEIWIDPLTQLGNRRLFDDRFGDIYRAQSEAGQDLSIVMIDVDYFKTLNDTLGHRAGDEVLAFAGELLKQGLREQDLAIRCGGDEFLLILPSVGDKDAVSVAERLVRLFAQQTRLLEVEPKPTMSAGVASLKAHRPATPAGLLQLADQALYEAKKAGRSQVCVCRGTGQPVR